jgi:hypothetical protein
MLILFEEYHYDHDHLKNILGENFYVKVSKSNQKRKINYVGYYCGLDGNKEQSEPVLIFPKVFLQYDKQGENAVAFGLFKPEEIINVSIISRINTIELGSITPSLVYEMSVWLYRAIDKYRKNCDNENISETGFVNPVVSRKDNRSSTELEIIEALKMFYEENRSLFTFIAKKSNSQKHKIKWSKTLANKTPVIVDGRPIYFDVHSKTKTIDYDEELIRIFFSVLNEVNSKYGFDFNLDLNYKLITGMEYRRLERRGNRYLKSIRYRYFSDKMLKLHELLSIYFERLNRSRVGKSQEEYVLIKDFNRVFEEMIDKLIGDKAEGDIKKMKSQPDNKQLDHIYKERGVFQKDEIYFIADSKYYTEKSTVDPYSAFKQFTYARNILALNLDIFKGDYNSTRLKYQDELTDGYHPTPNFFISAFFNDQMKSTDSGLSNTGHIEKTAHWSNRLFDRDTLFTLSYRINFMFVLQAYIRKNNARTNAFKKETRARFRTEFIEYLDKTYLFFNLKPLSELRPSIYKHFKILLGVSFCPIEEKEELLMAFENKEFDTGKSLEEVKKELEKDWKIEGVKLSEYERKNN